MRCEKKNYFTCRLATEDNIMRRMRLAYWITKVTETHPEYVILISFTSPPMVKRTRLNVMLYVYCLSFFFVVCITLLSASYILERQKARRPANNQSERIWSKRIVD